MMDGDDSSRGRNRLSYVTPSPHLARDQGGKTNDKDLVSRKPCETKRHYLFTSVQTRHVVVSAPTLSDHKVHATFSVAGRLRVSIEVTQLVVFQALSVWRRQVCPLKQ